MSAIIRKLFSDLGGLAKIITESATGLIPLPSSAPPPVPEYETASWDEPPPPPLPTGPVSDAEVIAMLKRTGVIPADAPDHAMVRVIDHRRGSEAGPEAGPDDGTDGHAPDGAKINWSVWNDIMVRRFSPGWSPCRFALRYGEADGMFVYGIVRDGLGIHAQPVRACASFNPDTNPTELANPVIGEIIVSTVTSLFSGVCMGTFADHASAVTAAETALAVVSTWSNPGYIDDPKAGMAAWRKTQQAWVDMGIRIDPHRHYHPLEGGPPGSIFYIDHATLAEGRPEKLS